MRRQETVYQVAAYLRLSRDDREGNSRTESNSIANQRALILSYLEKKKDMVLRDVYVDDGYTGSNFERPGYKRMMSDIEVGKVNCVIVKDLSRFGRDYLKTGWYLQKVFPSMEVRFLALTDGYDSLYAGYAEQEIVLPVKNFINDSYCRDISTKVRSQFRVRWEQGEYLGAFPVYGYRKSEDEPNQLVPDPYAAKVVRRIFYLKLNGMADYAIARQLDEEGVLSPLNYKQMGGGHFFSGFASGDRGASRWSAVAVNRILKDEIYLGHLRQGRRKKINYKSSTVRTCPKEEWVRAYDTQEAIVSRDTFSIAQQLLQREVRRSMTTENPDLFAGLIRCGDCGEQMIRRVNRSKNGERIYYLCSTKNRGEGCSRHSIRQEVLQSLVCRLLEKELLNMGGREVFCRVQEALSDWKGDGIWEQELVRMQLEYERQLGWCSGVETALQKGILNPEEAQQLRQFYEGRVSHIRQMRQQQVDALEQKRMRSAWWNEQIMQWKEDCAGQKKREFCMVFSAGSVAALRQWIISFVQEIQVYEGRRIRVRLRICDSD